MNRAVGFALILAGVFQLALCYAGPKTVANSWDAGIGSGTLGTHLFHELKREPDASGVRAELIAQYAALHWKTEDRLSSVEQTLLCGSLIVGVLGFFPLILGVYIARRANRAKHLA